MKAATDTRLLRLRPQNFKPRFLPMAGTYQSRTYRVQTAALLRSKCAPTAGVGTTPIFIVPSVESSSTALGFQCEAVRFPPAAKKSQGRALKAAQPQQCPMDIRHQTTASQLAKYLDFAQNPRSGRSTRCAVKPRGAWGRGRILPLSDTWSLAKAVRNAGFQSPNQRPVPLITTQIPPAHHPRNCRAAAHSAHGQTSRK